MKRAFGIIETLAVALVVVMVASPVMAGWGDGQAVFGVNGQKIDANTAGEVSIVDDTDAVTLLTFGLKSEKTYSDMDDNDQIVVNLLEAKNSVNEDIVYATLTTVIGDVTDATEDATVAIKAMVAGTLTTLATYTAAGPSADEVTIDGKYAAVGGDATTGLMLQKGSITSLNQILQTNSYAVAFGAVPVVTVSYTEDPGDVQPIYLTTITASNFVCGVTADKNFAYTAIGTRP